VKPELWREELKAVGAYLAEFGAHLPPALSAEHAAALARLG
jgi:mono/diheme cytochrome c family protein